MCLVVSASTPQKWHTLPHIRKQHRISKLIEEDNEKGEGRLMNKVRNQLMVVQEGGANLTNRMGVFWECESKKVRCDENKEERE